MLRIIVVKEIADHLKSLRFMLTVLMVVVLFIASALLFIPDYHRQIDDYAQNRNEANAELSRRASQSYAMFHLYSFNYNGPWVYREPNHLGFISEGQERNLPNAFQPSAFKVYGPSTRVRSNLLLWRSEALDWSLIVGIVLSFAAIVLVYDALSGDRENGTLGLSLANNVSRATVLIGKFLGAFVCLAAALAVGVLTNLVILTVSGGIPFVTLDWAVIGLAFVLSLVYISVFLMLGLFVSGRTHESSVSLVVALLCWALFVIVIPRSGGFASTKIMKILPWHETAGKANEASGEAKEDYNEKHPEVKAASTSGHWSPSEPLERALIMSDAWMGVVDGYRNRMIEQVEFARKTTMISPYASFVGGLEMLTESGIVHYRRFFEQIRNHRLELRRHLLDLYPLPTTWNAWDENMRREYGEQAKQLANTVDFESIPKFEEHRSNLKVLVNRAQPYLLLLVLFGAVFFAGAYVSFLVYDVR